MFSNTKSGHENNFILSQTTEILKHSMVRDTKYQDVSIVLTCSNHSHHFQWYYYFPLHILVSLYFWSSIICRDGGFNLSTEKSTQIWPTVKLWNLWTKV